MLYEPISGDDGEGNALRFLDVLESVDEDIPTFIEAMRHMERFAKHPEVINKIAEVYGDD